MSSLNKIEYLHTRALEKEPNIEIVFEFDNGRFHATRFNRYLSKLELSNALHNLADRIVNDDNLK